MGKIEKRKKRKQSRKTLLPRKEKQSTRSYSKGNNTMFLKETLSRFIEAGIKFIWSTR